MRPDGGRRIRAGVPGRARSGGPPGVRRLDVPLNLRPGRPEEAGVLSELALRSKAHWGYDDAFMHACRDELTLTGDDVDRLAVVVAEVDGAIVGFYGLETRHDEVELAYLFVDPPWIRTGSGRRLMEHAVTAARQRGLRGMVIQSDPFAEGFYAAMGAVRVGSSPSGSIPGRMLPVLVVDLGTAPR